jgi:RNA polymerase sigma-70 factor (ECF subfamily)
MSRRGPAPTVSIDEVGEQEFVEPPFWNELLWREQSGQLMEAINELPDIHKMLVQVCDIEGLTYEEAAQAMDIPVGTVRSRLFRARAALRQKLSPRLGQILGVEGC